MRQAVINLPTQPIRNLALDPVGGSSIASGVLFTGGRWFGGGTAPTPAGTYTDQTAKTDGPLPNITTYKRKTWTVGTATAGSNGDTGFQTGRIGNPWLCSPGEQYAVSYWMRHSSATAKLYVVNYYWYDAAGVGIGTTPRTGATAVLVNPSASWTRMTHIVTVPALAFRFLAIPDVTSPLGGAWAAGDTLDVTGFMVTRIEPGMSATTIPDFAMPGYPGWSWSGNANSSESGGYPYSLESIAGAPAAVNTVPGSTVPVGAMGAMQGRTLYTVYDALTANDLTQNLSLLGISSSGGSGTIYTRSLIGQPNNLDSVMRPTGPGTVVASFAQVSGAGRVIGRHVSALSVSDGLTSLGHTIDAVTSATDLSTDPGTGLSTVPNLILSPATSDLAPVAAYAFASEHTLETRKRVSGWLMRNYQATTPIPAGY